MITTFELIAIGEEKPDFLSWWIQWGIKANYSHVAVLVNGETIYHSIEKGVCKTTLKEMMAEKACVIRRRILIPVERECCALTWLEARLDTPYSAIQYLGFIFPFLRFIPWINNGRRELVCSEFGAEFCCEQAIQKLMVQAAFGDCDWIDPKKCLDVAAVLFGEEHGS